MPPLPTKPQPHCLSLVREIPSRAPDHVFAIVTSPLTEFLGGQANGPTIRNVVGPARFLALREFVGLWSGWLVVEFMLGGVLGRRSFGGL